MSSEQLFFFLETIELSKVITFYGGIVFQWLWWWVCLWFMWLFIGSCFVLCLLLTLCLTVRSSVFELLIVSTLVQWWLASNHYLYHGWPTYETSNLIIICVIYKIMHLWIMVIIFLGDIELILVSHVVFTVVLHSIQWNSYNFLSEILIVHFAFPLLKINPLLLTFLWVNIPLTLYVLIVVTHNIPDWFIVNHFYDATC